MPFFEEMWQSLAFFSGDKIYTDVNDNSNMGYIRVCDDCAIKLLKSTVGTLTMVVVSMNIYVGFPITSSIFTGDLQMPVPVYLPFTDYTTTLGLVLNLMNNVYIGTVGLAGTVGIELITCLLKNTVLVSTATVCYAIDEVTVMLEKSKELSKRVIGAQFRNILVQVQDLDR